ncbi:MAG TPA: hypothetical protein VFX49_11810 [Chloroflexota bacterium]|nr:hypothetical protein [Chloroflexota bacterium]
MLDALTAINVAYLRKHPEMPRLYAAGVRYRREAPGKERWASIPVVYALRCGDCEDLACWRTAELLVAGEKARATFTSKETATGVLYHIKVLRQDGRVEDPSLRLGMRGPHLHHHAKPRPLPHRPCPPPKRGG